MNENIGDLDEFDYLERNVWAEDDNDSGNNNNNSQPSPITPTISSPAKQQAVYQSPPAAHATATTKTTIESSQHNSSIATGKHRRSSDDDNEEMDLAKHQISPVSSETSAVTTSTYAETNFTTGTLAADMNRAEIEDDNDDEEVEKIVIPPLTDLIPDHDRVGFAALCYQTFYELAFRYCRYEFLASPQLQQTQLQLSSLSLSHQSSPFSSRPGSSSSVTIRKRQLEDRSLLAWSLSDGSDEDEQLDSSSQSHAERFEAVKPLFFADFDKTTSSDFPESVIYGNDNQVPSVFLNASNISDTNASNKNVFGHEMKRIPFGEEIHNPESIEDAIRFNRKLDGNVLLCHALKRVKEWSFSIMDDIYTNLHIEPQERSFIEKGIEIGLEPFSLVQSLSFINMPDGEQKDYIISNALYNILLILLASQQGKYDSLSRSYLKQLSDHLRLEWIDVLEKVELPLIRSLTYDDSNSDEYTYLRKIEDRERKKVEEKLAKKEKRKRIVYMTAAAIGGGAIIGVTTGLAAPLLGAGIGAALAAMKIAGGASAFFGSVGGTALITSSGTIIGTSVGGMKMEKRTRDVEYARFVPIGGSGSNVIVCVSGWLMSRDGKGKNLPTRQRSLTEPDTAIDSSSSSDGEYHVGKKKKKHDRSATEATVKLGETQLTEEVIANGLYELLTPFMGMSPINGLQYNFIFDPHILQSLGDALKLFASELISFSANQILAQTILSTLMSGLTWPMWLLKLGYLVDNPWSNGLERSRKAGKIMADNIKSCGHCVSLVGYSLGARSIFFCLLELAKSGCFGLIEDVFLFGAPILIPSNNAVFQNRGNIINKDKCRDFIVDPGSEKEDSPNRTRSFDEWRMAVSVVGGRFVNAYSRSDWVLGFLFRGSVAGMWDVAGLRPVILDSMMDIRTIDDYENGKYYPGAFKAQSENVGSSTNSSRNTESPRPRSQSQPAPPPPPPAPPTKEEKLKSKQHVPVAIIENIDITSQVIGHMGYRAAMPPLLKKICGYEIWTDDLEVIEEVVGGDWLETVDGWWSESKSKRKRVWSTFSAASSSASVNTKTGSENTG